MSFDQLQFVQKGSSTVIQSSGQKLAILNEVQPNQLTAGDFASFSQFGGMTVPAILA